jgi:hypothetical protein
MPHGISTVSREYVRVPVAATISGVAYDPTHDTVQMGFTPGYSNDPPLAWNAAVWDSGGPPYYALCLVGPGGTTSLTVGTYQVWVRITDNPEQPALLAGQLVVY